MLMDFDHLSIWEIAHRWHDVDPNTSNPEALPLGVQDLLRTITYMQTKHFLPVLKKSGVELKSERNFPSFEEFLSEADSPAPIDNEELWLTEIREDYFEQKDDWCRRHDEATEGLEQCYKVRIFDRATLESIHLDRRAIAEFCREKQLDLPAFWFTEQEREFFTSSRDAEFESPVDEDAETELSSVGKIKQEDADRYWSRLTNSQQRRMLCRAVASVLWEKDPTLTQAAIMDHAVIREYCGAKFYSDPNTVRNWIKDLDPRPENKRRGRPSDQ